MAGFGGEVKLSGEQEYRQALQQITKNLQQMSTALKQQAQDFSNSDKNMKNSASRQEELVKAISEQEKAVAQARTAYSQYSVALTEQQTKHQMLTREYRNAVQELEKIRAEQGENSEAYIKQAQVVDKLGQELAESNESMDESKRAMAQLRTEINNGQKVIDSATQELSELDEVTEESGKDAEKASEGYTVFKNVLANLATEGIKLALDGMKKLGQAFINVGKQSIDAYANFEQLEGGVNKIFGEDAGQQVVANAQNAFKTVGISANDYMEQVTSFSATLLQGMGDDTEGAVRIADRAMQDMADNANTFGTDISSVMSAYQGFAKDNYTMLDNLKLGYGGTAGEMARLINDSGVMGDSFKATAENVKEIPFDKLIEAISVTQERMGIMGTTAKEAGSTIQGSLGMLSASWTNLLTGLADSDADIGTLLQNFADSVLTFADVIKPRIQQVIEGIGIMVSQLLQTLVPELVAMIPPLLESTLPVLISAVQSIIQAVLAVLPQVISVISTLIPQIVSTIISELPMILDSGIQIILSLIQGITEALPELIGMLPDLIMNICSVLIDNLDEIIDTGMEFIFALVDGILSALPDLLDKLPEIIIQMVDKLLSMIPKIIDAGIRLLTSLVDNLPAIIQGVCKAIPQIISGLITAISNNMPAIVDAGVRLLVALVSNIDIIVTQVVKAIPQIIKGIVSALAKGVPEMVSAGGQLMRGLAQGISGLGDWVWQKVRSILSGLTSRIKSFFGIHSPSALFRDEIGENLALGLGEGFVDEMSSVTKEMQNAIPTSFDVNSNLNGISGATDYNYMVQAFKEALYQVKIELDDEVAGRFVDKTVTNLIYT